MSEPPTVVRCGAASIYPRQKMAGQLPSLVQQASVYAETLKLSRFADQKQGKRGDFPSGPLT